MYVPPPWQWRFFGLMSVRSPRKVLIFIIKKKIGSEYPQKNWKKPHCSLEGNHRPRHCTHQFFFTWCIDYYLLGHPELFYSFFLTKNHNHWIKASQEHSIQCCNNFTDNVSLVSKCARWSGTAVKWLHYDKVTDFTNKFITTVSPLSIQTKEFFSTGSKRDAE